VFRQAAVTMDRMANEFTFCFQMYSPDPLHFPSPSMDLTNPPNTAFIFATAENGVDLVGYELEPESGRVGLFDLYRCQYDPSTAGSTPAVRNKAKVCTNVIHFDLTVGGDPVEGQSLTALISLTDGAFIYPLEARSWVQQLGPVL
jgi:hypothetical protein